MLAATLLATAAVLPLGVWPTQTGDAAVNVQDVEFYLVEPEDDYSILAVQPLAVPLRKAEARELQRLAVVATKLGADAVLLLGEMSEKAIPKDTDTPLPTTGRYSVAVFLSFDETEGWDGKQAVPSALHAPRGGGRHHRAPGHGGAASARTGAR
ncbi:MAG TPA: hypothetical protein VMT19_05830 [Thermoanaerobaculaceae bacterium]|nr:hypothetical protein [Thermoanaerobaculaceae bacterium]